MSRLLTLFDKVVHSRPADEEIRGPYLFRWHVIPKNPVLNIYFHWFLGPDTGKWLHDHPWPSYSIVLEGGYKEYFFKEDGSTGIRRVEAGDKVFRTGKYAHKIVPIPSAKTIFITGPKYRDWGFFEKSGWVKHEGSQL